MAKIKSTVPDTNGDVLSDASFALPNAQALKNTEKNLTKSVNLAKDYTWNNKQAYGQLLQGLQAGESIPKIAKRLQNVSDLQKSSAIRNARTMVNHAENKGTVDSAEALIAQGAILTKEWIATGDDRTRDWHRDLNGIEVLYDDYFTNVIGDIKYPSDSSASGANVYNCRCSLRYHVKGFKNDTTTNYLTGKANYYEDNVVPSYKKMETNILKYQIQGKKIGESKNTKLFVSSEAKHSAVVAKYASEYSKLSMCKMFDTIKADTKLSNKYYTTLQAIGKDSNIGKPSQVWKMYVEGKLDAENVKKIDAIIDKYKEELKAVSKEKKALETAKETLKLAEKELNNFDIKVYSGIWKNDITTAEYALKKDSIALKKEYYEIKLEMLDSSDVAYAKYVNYIKQLEEFEEEGKKYLKLKEAVEEANKKVIQLTPKQKITTGISKDAYSKEAKKNAKKFSSKTTADRYHRERLDKYWNSFQDSEKYSVWEYTHNSNPINRSLSGYHEKWIRSYFVGYDKAVWGYEDKYRTIEISSFEKFGKSDGHVNYHKVITDLTNTIENSVFEDDVFLVRGGNFGGLTGMVESDIIPFETAEKILNSGDETKIKDLLLNNTLKNNAFTSTGIAKGTGFGGSVKYNIYAPKGTKGIYAEPQSRFGHTAREHLYKAGESYNAVGDEAEIILQRGTEFRVTKVEYDYGDITIDMEVINQPSYFKYGDEDTYNNGRTRHKK